jgi:hypothetical protein
VDTLKIDRSFIRHLDTNGYFSRPLPAEDCRELLLELAQRASLTDTLRLRIMRPGDAQPRPDDPNMAQSTEAIACGS